jgi:hypothetical protein
MLDLLARHQAVRELVMSTLIGLGVYVVCALTIVAAELVKRRDVSIYRTPNARPRLHSLLSVQLLQRSRHAALDY